MPISATLLEQLRQNEPSLTLLSLTGSNLRDNDIILLLQVLAQNTTVTSLNLQRNAIGDDSVQALAQNITLASLNLEDNFVGDDGAQDLALNTRLTSLSLDTNKISAIGALALALNTTLTSLSLDANKIGIAGAQALALNTTLTSLSLWGSDIGDAGAQALARNATLTTLNVANNKISNVGAQALAQNNTLNSLNLEHNKIATAGAQALALNTTLTSLYLGNNKIGAAGAHALALNTTLTSLGLESNQIGAAGAKALANNYTLTALNVVNNRIGNVGAQALAENKSLLDFNKSYCNLNSCFPDTSTSYDEIELDYIYRHLLLNSNRARQWLRACELGDIATLQTMLAQQQVSLYAFNTYSGERAWYIAVRCRQVFVLLFLLQQAANPRALFEGALKRKPIATPVLNKPADSLFLRTVQAIESYSNETIKNRVITTHNSLSAKSNEFRNTFFFESSSASPSATPQAGSIIYTTQRASNEKSIFAKIQQLYCQYRQKF